MVKCMLKIDSMDMDMKKLRRSNGCKNESSLCRHGHDPFNDLISAYSGM